MVFITSRHHPYHHPKAPARSPRAKYLRVKPVIFDEDLQHLEFLQDFCQEYPHNWPQKYILEEFQLWHLIPLTQQCFKQPTYVPPF